MKYFRLLADKISPYLSKYPSPSGPLLVCFVFKSSIKFSVLNSLLWRFEMQIFNWHQIFWAIWVNFGSKLNLSISAWQQKVWFFRKICILFNFPTKPFIFENFREPFLQLLTILPSWQFLLKVCESNICFIIIVDVLCFSSDWSKKKGNGIIQWRTMKAI